MDPDCIEITFDIMRRQKFRIRLFGEVFDSTSLAASGVQILGQRRLNIEAPGCFILEVSEFDDNHIKFRLYRDLKTPEDLAILDEPNKVLQYDQLVLFPELPTCPDFGGYLNVATSTENLLWMINAIRKLYRGSELSTMSIQSTPDYLDVEIEKN